MTSIEKPLGYWKNPENIRAECREYIRVHNKFPKSDELIAQGHTSLRTAIYKYPGGINKLRADVGLSAGRKPPNYWRDPVNVRNEASAVIAQEGNLPGSEEIGKRFPGLYRGLRKYPGGIFGLRHDLGMGAEERAPGYWDNRENVAAEFKKVVSEIGHVPTSSELWNMRRCDVLYGMQKHGGIGEFQKLFGITPKMKQGYWKQPENIRSELKKVIDELGRFPQQRDFRKRKMHSLYNSMLKYPGASLH